MVSEDGFVNGLGSFQIELATDGHISHFENAKVGARLDFEALKAAGYTPAAWISGFQPYLIVTLLAPEMKPQNAEVLADGDSIGSLTFP